MATFSTKEAAALMRTNPRNVDYWHKLGIATAVEPGKGTGSARGYDHADLLVLLALTEMADDTSVATRRKVSAELRANLRRRIVRIHLSDSLDIFVNLSRLRARLKEAEKNSFGWASGGQEKTEEYQESVTV